jgi:hypothetical protein
MNKVVLASSIVVLAFVSLRCGIAQQTRESAVKGMRQLDPKELDLTYQQKAPFAQKLVDDQLAKHPKVILIGLHVTPPDHPNNVIIASNFGRVGKLADKDDMKVINSGTPNFDVEPAGMTYEAEMALREKSGTIIGAVSIVFNYKQGEDIAPLMKEAKAIGRSLNSQITTRGKLFGPA